MALFGGRDRSGNVDFKGQGSSSAFVMAVAVVTAIPTYLGYDNATASTTPGGLGAAVTIPANATHARIDVASGGGNLVYTCDGSTTPTATLGEVIPAGEAGEIACDDLTNVTLRSDAGTAAYSVSFRRYDTAS